MSNYDNLQLRYSCFSEPSLVSHSNVLIIELCIRLDQSDVSNHLSILVITAYPYGDTSHKTNI